MVGAGVVGAGVVGPGVVAMVKIKKCNGFRDKINLNIIIVI